MSKTRQHAFGAMASLAGKSRTAVGRLHPGCADSQRSVVGASLQKPWGASQIHQVAVSTVAAVFARCASLFSVVDVAAVAPPAVVVAVVVGLPLAAALHSADGAFVVAAVAELTAANAPIKADSTTVL